MRLAGSPLAKKGDSQVFYRCLRYSSSFLKLYLEVNRKRTPGTQCVPSFSVVPGRARLFPTSGAPPPWGKMLGPTKPPLSKVTHVPTLVPGKPPILLSGVVTQNIPTTPRPEPGSPPFCGAQHFHRRPFSQDTQLPRAVSRTPHFTPDSQYAEEGSGSGNQMALDPTRMKNPQTGSHIRNV